MKLLFTQSLSPKLAPRLNHIFPSSTHAQTAGVDCVSDDIVWDYALSHGLCIVTKDEDYSILSVARGCPPKVIWLQIGNCTTREVEAVFRARITEITLFENDPTVGTLVLS
jgi:predicted nuclease of predicted toxin-antitoxin system